MKAKDYLALLLISTAVILAMARFLPVAGYMDAEYYYANGTQLAKGQGFSEPFLWNYLDDPAGIPHPANTYWMPLASILSALGMLVAGKVDFSSARIFFVLIACLIPPLTANVSWRLSHQRMIAWLAGGLAVFSGYYAIYMGLSDTFALYMFLGTIFLILGTGDIKPAVLKYFGLGLLAGLMHLTRADGILWLACGTGLVVYEVIRNRVGWKIKLSSGLLSSISVFIGYGLVMLPWYVRNIDLYGALFSPAGSRAFWLANYDQMFAFPASQLNLQSWLASGLGNIIQVRFDALALNLENLLAVQAEIFLLPLIILGAWRLRKERMVRLALSMWLVTFFLMSLVFPLAGSRGGFFHSGAAFQPVFWALAGEGFAGLIALGVRKRSWKFERATKGFGILTILVSTILTLAIFLPQVIPDETHSSAWSASEETYQAVGQYLAGSGAGSDAAVMVNNPPGYFVATGRPAVVIPDGGIDTALSAAKKYGARYLALEQNTVVGLRDLYENPRSMQGLSYIQTVERVEIFEFVSP